MLLILLIIELNQFIYLLFFIVIYYVLLSMRWKHLEMLRRLPSFAYQQIKSYFSNCYFVVELVDLCCHVASRNISRLLSTIFDVLAITQPSILERSGTHRLVEYCSSLEMILRCHFLCYSSQPRLFSSRAYPADRLQRSSKHFTVRVRFTKMKWLSYRNLISTLHSVFSWSPQYAAMKLIFSNYFSLKTIEIQ